MKNIKEIAYQKYQLHWLMSHGYTVEYINCIAYDWFNERLTDPDNDDTLADYIFERGINGSLWASYDEFIEIEYQDAGYMEEVLSKNEYTDYCMDIGIKTEGVYIVHSEASCDNVRKNGGKIMNNCLA